MPNKTNQQHTSKQTKKNKKENSEYLIETLAKEHKWMIFVGGDDQERKRLASVAAFESWKEWEKVWFENKEPTYLRFREDGKTFIKHKDGIFKWNSESYKLLGTFYDRPLVIDFAGCTARELKETLLGGIKDFCLSGNIFKELKESGGHLALLEFEGVPVTYHNLSFRGSEKDEKIQVVERLKVILEEIKVYDKSFPSDLPHVGMVILCLKSNEDMNHLPDGFEDMFEVVTLDGEEANTSDSSQELQQIKYILFYDRTTGKFRFGDNESIPVSKNPRAKVRDMAEKLMKSWNAGKPCPQSEILKNPDKTPPQSYYDNITKIRNSLKGLRVNMPQCAEEAYHPPSEPKYFNIVS